MSGSTQIVKYKGYSIQVERSSVSGGGGISGSMRLDELAGMLQGSKEMIYIKMKGRDLKLLRQFVQEWIDVIYYQDINKVSLNSFISQVVSHPGTLYCLAFHLQLHARLQRRVLLETRRQQGNAKLRLGSARQRDERGNLKR